MSETNRTALDLEGGVIVSCQAPQASPLGSSDTIARIGEAAVDGGAVGLRINSANDLMAARRRTRVPLIGLHKTPGPERSMITMTISSARELVAAGADVVAVDATVQAWGSLKNLARTVRAYVSELAVPVLADVSTLEEGLVAWEAGAGFVGTTLSGYTPYALACSTSPDIDLVLRLSELDVRVLAEGRYRTRAQLRSAFDSGAHAVVIGNAITNPTGLTAEFVEASPRSAGRSK